jgi:hypothetical protein
MSRRRLWMDVASIVASAPAHSRRGNPPVFRAYCRRRECQGVRHGANWFAREAPSRRVLRLVQRRGVERPDRRARPRRVRRSVRPFRAFGARARAPQAQRSVPRRGSDEDTFAAIWRSARTSRPERGPGAPGIYAVARNAIADRARARVDAVADVSDSPADEPGRRNTPSTSGCVRACTPRSRRSHRSSGR